MAIGSILMRYAVKQYRPKSSNEPSALVPEQGGLQEDCIDAVRCLLQQGRVHIYTQDVTYLSAAR
jgi:hypothetical protein